MQQPSPPDKSAAGPRVRLGLCTAAGEATLRLLGEKTKTLPASFFPTKETEKLTDRRSKSVTTDCDAALHPRVSSHVFNSQKKKKHNPKATACGAGAERKRRTQCSKTLLLKSWRRNYFFLSQLLECENSQLQRRLCASTLLLSSLSAATLVYKRLCTASSPSPN